MSINSYLKNLASELVLSESEKNHVATSVDTIEGRLITVFFQKLLLIYSQLIKLLDDSFQNQALHNLYLFSFRSFEHHTPLPYCYSGV